MVAVGLVWLLSGVAGYAEESTDPPTGKVIAGWIERLTLPATGRQVKAKLDTGANTSSIHAENIEQFEKDGETWVRFDLHGHRRDKEEDAPDPVQVERERARRVKIKDHDDPADRRPVVELEVCFDGRLRLAQFSLADRSNFLYPVLLGRRFLEGVAVVDPALKYATDPSCPEESESP